MATKVTEIWISARLPFKIISIYATELTISFKFIDFFLTDNK